MPRFEHVTCQVTVDGLDAGGYCIRRPLEEWGVHKMKSSRKVSAYIEAETGKSFRVLIQPTIPYPSRCATSAYEDNVGTISQARERGQEMENPSFPKAGYGWTDEGGSAHSPRDTACNKWQQEPVTHANYRVRRSNSFMDSSGLTGIREDPTHKPTSFSSPILAGSGKRLIERIPPPPFHFLASLFLDGRAKAERKVIIYLDPKDEDYNYPDGKIEIKTRWAQGKDGNLKEQSWVFQDVGIETLFDKMIIAGDIDINDPTPIQDGDKLVNAMSSTYLDGDNDMSREEKSQVGQILVTLERVILGGKWRDRNYRPKHNENEMQDVNIENANKEITHFTGFEHKKTVALKHAGLRVVDYTPYKENEGSFAVFQFFYRSKQTLARFNFPGFESAIPRHRHIQTKASILSFETPLSINSNSKLETIAKKPKVSFEDTIEENVTGDKTQPEHNTKLLWHEGGKVDKEEVESGSPITRKSRTKTLALRGSSMNKGFIRDSSPALVGNRVCKTKNQKKRIPNGPSISSLSLAAPSICVTPSSDSESTSSEFGIRGQGKVKGDRPATPYSTAFSGEISRDTEVEENDGDDEHVVSGNDTCPDSDSEQEHKTNEIVGNSGLSADFKGLAIGKRRHADNELKEGSDLQGKGQKPKKKAKKLESMVTATRSADKAGGEGVEGLLHDDERPQAEDGHGSDCTYSLGQVGLATIIQHPVRERGNQGIGSD